MAPPESESHRWAAVRQDNGELQEDVVERSSAEDQDPDLESEESFPASDAPSSWAGPDAEGEPPTRVVHSKPVDEEVPGRTHPGEAVPKTLPRD